MFNQLGRNHLNTIMRAKEFTINVPITISINGDDDPVVSAGEQSKSTLQQNPVMVPPLQQHLELDKAEQGKESPVIDKITANDSIGNDPNADDELAKIKQLLGR